MISPRRGHRDQGWRGARRRTAAYSRLEVLLVLVALGLAAALLVVALGRVRHQRAAERFVADLEQIAAVFQDHHRRHRTWPPSTGGEGRLPREIEVLLDDTSWDSGSPFGGSYGWDARGAVVLTAFAPSFPLEITRAELLALDRRMDDGDLATGRLRTGFNGWPVYFVAPTP